MMEMRVLLCTNGSAWANRALEMGKQIALATASAVDVLAVAQSAERLDEVGEAIEAAVADLQVKDIVVNVHQRVGGLAEEVIQQAHAAPYDLVVIGSRGRRGIKRLFLGSVAAHVIGHAPTSVMVVKRRRRALKQFLVCSAAGPVSENAVRFAGRLAQAVGASVTLIHVMSQLPVTGGADLVDLQAPANELIQRGSREGIHLSQMLDLLTVEGTSARAVVRHGLVVNEIIAEAKEGQFDLLVIGAHVTPGISTLLSGDLAEQILLTADLPILVVRQAAS
jgi:nucleotide-binding universal stress UspA family protein